MTSGEPRPGFPTVGALVYALRRLDPAPGLFVYHELFHVLTVAAAVESVRPVVQAYGHTLDLVLPERPLRMNGDPTRLTQVVVNLLTYPKYFWAGWTAIAWGLALGAAWPQGLRQNPVPERGLGEAHGRAISGPEAVALVSLP